MTSAISLSQRTIEGTARGPHLVITAGVHGDEFEGMAACRRLIAELDPKRLSGKVTIVPVVNEQAFLCGQRTAEDGLDLARRCPGNPAGSITDRIAVALTRLIQSADYYIDLHSGGAARCVAPLAGYMVHSDAAILDKQRRMAKAFNLPLVWGTSSALEGRSLSVARDAGVPAIYTEYLGSGVCNEQGVDDYYEGCLNVMRELEMIERATPYNKVERVVEDIRPDSGHLQIAHPAPITGYFEPAVKLWQEVRVGELIGRVVNSVGNEVRDIHAQSGGIVICLMTFSSVLAGTGLVVVLETDIANSTSAVD